MTSVPATPKEASFYQAVRPFAWLAVAAFVLGFLGYVTLGGGATARAHAQAAAVTAEPAAAGPSSDEWNLPKHI